MSEEVKNEKSKSKKVGRPKPTALQIAFRREKISELMLAGVDDTGVRRIAEYLKKINIECSKSTVANDIKFLLSEAATKSINNLEQKRELSNLRLESLISTHWLESQRGNLKSGRFVRDLINDQNELYGTKAATKLEHRNPDGSGLMEPVAAAVNEFNRAAIKIYGTGDKSTDGKS